MASSLMLWSAVCQHRTPRSLAEQRLERITMPTAFADVQTFADLLDELGGVSPNRIRFRPAPGHATEKDVVRLEASENRLFELVDGVLVEKAMGAKESLF